MDSSLLRVFLKVYEAGTINRAAASLGLSQPAVTKKLHRLEDEVRAPLFDRTRRGVSPTPYGRALAEHAQVVEADLRLAQSVIDQLRDGAQGQVQLGTSPALTATLLPAVLVDLRRQRPGIRVRITEGLPEDLLSAVRDGRIDVAACSHIPGASRAGVASEPLLRDRFFIVIGARHRLFARRRVSPDELVTESWVISPNLGDARRWFERRFDFARSAQPHLGVETTSVACFRELVASGEFVGFAPEQMFATELRARQARLLLRDSFAYSRDVSLLTRQKVRLPPATLIAIDLIRRHAGGG